jgi:hypothetical protein
MLAVAVAELRAVLVVLAEVAAVELVLMELTQLAELEL